MCEREREREKERESWREGRHFCAALFFFHLSISLSFLFFARWSVVACPPERSRCSIPFKQNSVLQKFDFLFTFIFFFLFRFLRCFLFQKKDGDEEEKENSPSTP